MNRPYEFQTPFKGAGQGALVFRSIRRPGKEYLQSRAVLPPHPSGAQRALFDSPTCHLFRLNDGAQCASVREYNGRQVKTASMTGSRCRCLALTIMVASTLACVVRSYGQASTPLVQSRTLLEALQSTLDNQPALRIQEQQVVVGRAARRQATGQFDAVLGSKLSQNRINTPLTPYGLTQEDALLGTTTDNQVTNLSLFDIGATKQYRSGVTISPSFQNTRLTDNIYNIPGANQSTLSFQVTVPLLRGRGRSAVAAQETAAGIEVEARLLDLNQTISNLLSNTASSYWSAVGAEKNLKVAQGSEERGRIYVENVQTLVHAGRVPEAEINQVNANLATRVAERIAAEQTLVAAQQQLALAMGLTADKMADVGMPSDDFPKDDDQTLAALDPKAIQQFFDLAQKRRADYLAAKRRDAEQRALLVAARNTLRPQIDLNLNSGYSSLAEGTGLLDFLRAPGRTVKGPDLGAGITYRFPPSNNTALGELMLTQANLRQAELRTLQTSQSIMAAVVTAVAGVRNAALQLRKAREAVAASQAALDGEREKYRLGVGQLVDVLTVEDRLTVALQNQVSAELAYALALTQLRAATGTIVEPDKTVQSVGREIFFTVPSPTGVSGKGSSPGGD
jgi:outer membrane protein TolC